MLAAEPRLMDPIINPTCSNRSAALLKLKKITKALEDADECIRLKPGAGGADGLPGLLLASTSLSSHHPAWASACITLNDRQTVVPPQTGRRGISERQPCMRTRLKFPR